MKMKIGYTKEQIEKSRVLRKPIITLVVDGRYCGGEMNAVQETEPTEDLLALAEKVVIAKKASDSVLAEQAARDEVFAQSNEEAIWETIANSVGKAVADKLF